LLFLPACVNQHQNSFVDISFDEKPSLSFTGRGAAAGIMLDSVMVGGAAIGIAIDQGIAKDISNNILKQNPSFDFREFVRQQLTQSQISSIESIKIKTWGFKSAPDDQVSAWLVLDVVKNRKSIQVNYPEDFSAVKTENFMKVKESSNIAINLLNNALSDIFK